MVINVSQHASYLNIFILKRFVVSINYNPCRLVNYSIIIIIILYKSRSVRARCAVIVAEPVLVLACVCVPRHDRAKRKYELNRAERHNK